VYAGGPAAVAAAHGPSQSCAHSGGTIPPVGRPNLTECGQLLVHGALALRCSTRQAGSAHRRTVVAELKPAPATVTVSPLRLGLLVQYVEYGWALGSSSSSRRLSAGAIAIARLLAVRLNRHRYYLGSSRPALPRLGLRILRGILARCDTHLP
jgi:hypothetical protein